MQGEPEVPANAALRATVQNSRAGTNEGRCSTWCRRQGDKRRRRGRRRGRGEGRFFGGGCWPPESSAGEGEGGDCERGGSGERTGAETAGEDIKQAADCTDYSAIIIQLSKILFLTASTAIYLSSFLNSIFYLFIKVGMLLFTGCRAPVV